MHVKHVPEKIKETRSLEAEVSARSLIRDVLVVPEDRWLDRPSKPAEARYQMVVMARAKEMLGKDEYRQLEVRLAKALALVEGTYSEARKRNDM